MDLEYLSKIGGLNIGYTELLGTDGQNVFFYAINTDPHKTLKAASQEKITQIDYFTLRDPDGIDKKKIKNNLLGFINKTTNYSDKEKDKGKLDTNKTAFDMIEDIKIAKINFYRPEKTIPINDYLNLKVEDKENFSENEINSINASLAKTYRNYYGFCEYITGLREKN